MSIIVIKGDPRYVAHPKPLPTPVVIIKDEPRQQPPVLHPPLGGSIDLMSAIGMSLAMTLWRRYF